MGKTRRAMMAFIDESPDPKLEGGISSGTIYTDYRNFRIDMQGTTPAKDGKSVCYYIQMHINDRPKMTSLSHAAPSPVAKIEMPVKASWSAADIKEVLKKSYIEHGEKTGQ